MFTNYKNRNVWLGNFVDFDLKHSLLTDQNQVTLKVAECFSHFTYSKTNGKLCVLDLRTIQTEKNMFVISEPVIFSTMQNRFGSSDLGIKALEKFRCEHKCNSMCKTLGLREFYFK